MNKALTMLGAGALALFLLSGDKKISREELSPEISKVLLSRDPSEMKSLANRLEEFPEHQIFLRRTADVIDRKNANKETIPEAIKQRMIEAGFKKDSKTLMGIAQELRILGFNETSMIASELASIIDLANRLGIK